MAEHRRNEITRLLLAIGRGDARSDDALLRRIYADLRSIAGAKLRGRRNETLQPTALVHEAYLQLLGGTEVSWENRRHFFFAAARAMQDVMVAQARRKAAVKRGGGWERTELDELAMVVEDPGFDVLALEEALDELAVEHPRKVEVVRLRFFGGLTNDEVAELLGVSARTALREWRFARARLFVQLGGDPAEEREEA